MTDRVRNVLLAGSLLLSVLLAPRVGIQVGEDVAYAPDFDLTVAHGAVEAAASASTLAVLPRDDEDDDTIGVPLGVLATPFDAARGGWGSGRGARNRE